MEIVKFQLGDYRTNCYIISNNGDAMVIDPGIESKEVVNYLTDNLLSLGIIYITHGHHDHVGGVNYLKTLFNCKVYAPKKDKIWLGKSSYNRTGMPVDVDLWVSHLDSFNFLDQEWKVYETPGHTEGSTVLYTDNHLFSGDTLFFESIGRSDLPLSNPMAIMDSIKYIYEWFSDDVVVHPGHGKETSIGYEKLNNPFVNEENY